MRGGRRKPGGPIDVSGQLADGRPVNGVVTLRQAILDRPELFVGTMTEKLMIYALGRGVSAEDMPDVRRILREASANDYRFSSLVLGIVKSVPFQMRVKPVAEPVSVFAVGSHAGVAVGSGTSWRLGVGPWELGVDRCSYPRSHCRAARF